MLSLKKLTFNNIGRFITEQTIDFNDFNGLVQVDGVNLNTGGSSGAGKSTAFHAVDYLLGINDIPASSLQSRLTKESIIVVGEFISNNKTLIIKRSKKEGLTIIFDGETVSGNVKLAEERLQEIIGIPKKLFKKMIHKKQKEGGFFLNLTAKESYEFLISSVGLEKTSKKTEKVDDIIKECNNRITQLGHAISSLESSIDEIEELQEFEKEPICDVSEVKLVCANSKVLNFQNIIEKTEKERDSNIFEASQNKPEIPALFKPESSDLESWKHKLVEKEQTNKELIYNHLQSTTSVNEAINKINTELAKVPFHKEHIKTKAKKMQQLLERKKHLEDEKCPTCMQKWTESSQEIETINIRLDTNKREILEHKSIIDGESILKEKIKRISDILKNKTDEYNVELEESKNNISKIKEEIVKIKVSFDSKNSQIENEYLKKLNEFNLKISEAKSSYDNFIKDNEALKNSAQMELNKLNQEFENYSINIEMYNIKTAKYTNMLSEKRKSLKDSILQRENKVKELSVAEETKRLIKTYTLQVFQDTLDYIGQYATEMLSNIPNMTNTSIYFEGCKENKSGTIKDEVNAIINMDGYDNVNIKTLSGGERTVIDLAVDLAVIDMIESRAGKGADFFILDEPFDGLEDVNIIQCLEVLQQVDCNKKIIIVDHNPIAKEMITDNIIIERNKEQSVVL